MKKSSVIVSFFAFVLPISIALSVQGFADEVQVIQAYLESDDDAFPTDGSVQLTKDQVHRHLKATKTKHLTITCPELQNTTFTNDPPFDVLGIPECGKHVEPQIVLYLPQVPGGNQTQECALLPMNLPNKNTTDCFKTLNKRKDVRKLVILIHGFLNSFSTEWLHVMQSDIQRVDSGTAVMVSLRRQAIINKFVANFSLSGL